jgi:hypothetical protein
MASRVKQNRVVIELACENLERAGFTEVKSSKDQGTYPDTYILARRNGTDYFVGVTGRKERRKDGDHNPEYNLIVPPSRLDEVRRTARQLKRVPAFVALPLRPQEGTYLAYFGKLERIGDRGSVPMLPRDRRNYELLTPIPVPDPRVADLA